MEVLLGRTGGAPKSELEEEGSSSSLDEEHREGGAWWARPAPPKSAPAASRVFGSGVAPSIRTPGVGGDPTAEALQAVVESQIPIAHTMKKLVGHRGGPGSSDESLGSVRGAGSTFSGVRADRRRFRKHWDKVIKEYLREAKEDVGISSDKEHIHMAHWTYEV